MLKVYTAQLENDVPGGLSKLAWKLLERACLREGVRVDRGRIAFGEHGKPYLQDSSLFFNLSHSGDMALCAVSDREVGCDLQIIKPVRPAVCKRIFTDAERAYIENGPEEDKDKRYTRLWTYKESFVKWTGEGLSRNLKDIVLDLDMTPVQTVTKRGDRVFFYTIESDKNTLGTICTSYQIATFLPCFRVSVMVE